DLVAEPLTVAIAVTGDQGSKVITDPYNPGAVDAATGEVITPAEKVYAAATKEDLDATTGLTYTVSLNRASSADTEVVVTLTGKADAADIKNITLASDKGAVAYNEINNTVTVKIPAGETSVSFLLDPVLEASTAAFDNESPETVIASITNTVNADETATIKASETLADGTVLNNGEAIGVIQDGDAMWVAKLYGDLTPYYGPNAESFANYRQAGDTVPAESAAALTTDFGDVVYIGYHPDETSPNVMNNGALLNLGDTKVGQATDGNDAITTLDLAQGDDVLKIKGNISQQTRTYLGEGDDILRVGGYILSSVVNGTINDSDTSSAVAYVFGEAGNDDIAVVGRVENGAIYAGSGSDTVTTGSLGLTTRIDLGSGAAMPAAYLPEYQALPGVSLGNDNNTDLATDVNTLTVNGSVSSGANILGGEGQDTVTIKQGSDGDINLGNGNNTVNIAGFVGASGSITTGTGNDTAIFGANVEGDIDLGAGDDIVEIAGSTAAATTSIITGTGNDTVTIKGTARGVIELGDGDDVLNIGAAGANINGGDGIDTIKLTGAGKDIYLADLTGIEVLDLNGSSTGSAWNERNTLDLGSGQAATLENILKNPGLYVKGDEGDRVNVYPFLSRENTGNLAKTGEVKTDAAGLKYDVWQYGTDTNAVIYIQQGVDVF
ncbi:hypothetical protein B0681_10205, partial [Moraxella porci DSM 25326]